MPSPSSSSSAPADLDALMDLDAVAQAELLSAGDISAVELARAALARIERLNPLVNAVCSLDPERALAVARDVKTARPGEFARSGGSGGPLAGVPTLIKDLTAYPGLPVGAGSRIFQGMAAPAGSPYTGALDAAGLVVLGKSAASEFGLLGTTEPLVYGPTRNPFDLSRSPGGSSGGAAAAVAYGMIPVAHASDAGGSVRGPASLCGLFGFKPSRGRTVPNGVPDALPLSRLLSDHCLSRTVRDSAAWLAVTERTDADAPFAPVGFVREPASARLRIGFFRKDASGAAPEPDALCALEAARALCASLGHELIETDGPKCGAFAQSDAFFLMAGAGLAGLFAQMRALMGEHFRENAAEPYTRHLVELARKSPPEALARALAGLDAATALADEEMARFDVLLSPTTPFAAFPLGLYGPEADPAALMDFTRRLAGYTVTASAAGWPAMSVPLYANPDGLPLGVHFAAPCGHDERLLRLAYALEEAAPWAGRRPVLPGGRG